MEHKLRIAISKKHKNDGVLVCGQAAAREKLPRFPRGNPVKLTILVPGDEVDEVSIQEVTIGGQL